MKVELKHLAPYLPYELKLFYSGKVVSVPNNKSFTRPLTLNSIKDVLNGGVDVKPILRPLSDLTEEQLLELVAITQKHDIAPSVDYKIRLIQKPFGKVWKVEKMDQWYLYLSLDEPERIQHRQFTKLLEWHYDVFGLIDKGLAIDINTL